MKMDIKLSLFERREIEQKAVKAWMNSRIKLATKIFGALTAAVALSAVVPTVIRWLIALAQ